MKTIDKNIFDVKEGIICHQVNTKGVMGSGIAFTIKNKFPKAFDVYSKACKEVIALPKFLLGKTQLVQVQDDPRLFVANVFGQEDYGRDPDVRYTSYLAVEQALWDLKKDIEQSMLEDLPVYFPYNMGCGLGGGNWDAYSAIINEVFPNAIVCKFNPPQKSYAGKY